MMINRNPQTASDGRHDNMLDVRLPRTWTSTCFEIVNGILLLVLWVSIVFIIAMSKGKQIPIHYNFAGNPDSFGSPYWLLLLGAVDTALVVYYLIAAYRPAGMLSANVPIRNMRQVMLLSRWAYVFSIEFTVFCLTMVYGGLEQATLLFKLALLVLVATSLGVLVLLRAYK